MADPITFRVHFGDASHTDVIAATPDEARKVALKRRPGQIVSKIKVIRGEDHG
jgi:hypothetical protein